MSEDTNSPANPPASTAPTTQQATQTPGVPTSPIDSAAPPDEIDPESFGFEIGPGVTRAAMRAPGRRSPRKPLYRPLRIFTLDPAAALESESMALINVPFERLAPGPVGAKFEVVSDDAVDLDSRYVLLRSGLEPSVSDRRFHGQMAYAVASNVYAAFQAALGRELVWGFDGGPRLQLRLHDGTRPNAFYERDTRSIKFGVFKSDKCVRGRNLPNAPIFTCLSHDIVAHEVTHAILDGLRSEFLRPTNKDVLAFHEAFADIIAIFLHFSYERVVRSELLKRGPDFRRADTLTALARQFADAGGSKLMRTAVQQRENGEPLRYTDVQKPHELGSVLVSAVFEAFVRIFEKRSESLMRIASLAQGAQMPTELADLLAPIASKTAASMLRLCIRAIDYCPPTDLYFGEYLRALITADIELVPDDKWGFRNAIIDAFRERDIYPPNVESLSVDSLRWRPPEKKLRRLTELSFARLRFAGDPSVAAGHRELKRQAIALGRFFTDPAVCEEFGVLPHGPEVNKARVESIRTARRGGPDGQVLFDLVAEVTQRRLIKTEEGRILAFDGGATIILDPDGRVRYVISKSISHSNRQRAQASYVLGLGREYWIGDDVPAPRPNLLSFVHEG